MAQGGILLQIDTCAVPCASSVLDGEAVPGDLRGRREVARLAEDAPQVLAVEDGGVRHEVALVKVESFRFVAREAAIHAHTLHHVESVVGGGVAVVGARRDPYHGVVRLGQGLRFGNGGERVVPAVAILRAGTLRSDVDDVSVLG